MKRLYSINGIQLVASSDRRIAMQQYHETMQSIREVAVDETIDMLNIYEDAPGFNGAEMEH